MRLFIAATFGLLSLLGCASLSQPKDTSIYAKVDALAFGNSIDQSIASLGQPSRCDKVSGKEKCFYEVPYKEKTLPLIELTFNADRKLTEKYMILAPSTLKLDLVGLKRRYPDTKLVKGESVYSTSKHSYSTNYFIEDKEKGLRVEYRPNLADAVQSILWSQPTLNGRAAASKN